MPQESLRGPRRLAPCRLNMSLPFCGRRADNRRAKLGLKHKLGDDYVSAAAAAATSRPANGVTTKYIA